jgi:hypothetical protein
VTRACPGRSLPSRADPAESVGRPSVFRHAVASDLPPGVSLEYVNAAAARPCPALRASRGGLALAASAKAGIDAVCALVAQDAIRILASNDRHNLRVCCADDCRMVYLSLGHRDRRWCSSDVDDREVDDRHEERHRQHREGAPAVNLCARCRVHRKLLCLVSSMSAGFAGCWL